MTPLAPADGGGHRQQSAQYLERFKGQDGKILTHPGHVTNCVAATRKRPRYGHDQTLQFASQLAVEIPTRSGDTGTLFPVGAGGCIDIGLGMAF